MRTTMMPAVRWGLLVTGVLLTLCYSGDGVVQAGRQSDANKADCVSWCAQNRAEGCERCASYSACGAGYESMRKFGTLGTWYACRKNDFGRRGEQHEQDCEAYCRSNPACVKCTAGACGSGIKILKTFSGEGKNWHACEKTDWAKNSEEAHAAALKWCTDYQTQTGADCRIVKSGQSCPDGFYKSDRLTVDLGRDYKTCLMSKSDTQRVKDCSGRATAEIEKALTWINTHYDEIVDGFRMQPGDYRNRRAHARLDRKFPQVTVQCEDHRSSCKNNPKKGGWSASARYVNMCYGHQGSFCSLVETIIHESGHNAWVDMERSQHVGDAGSKDDTVYQFGYRARDLCLGRNGGTNYNYPLN